MLTSGRVLIRNTVELPFAHLEELSDLGGYLNRKTRKGNSERRTPHGLPPLLGRLHQLLDALPA